MRKEGGIPFGLLYFVSGSNAGTDTLANDEGGGREGSYEDYCVDNLLRRGIYHAQGHPQREAAIE